MAKLKVSHLRKMKFKEFHRNMVYDEFGKKDYQGYILFVLMMGYALFIALGAIGWLIFLIGLK